VAIAKEVSPGVQYEFSSDEGQIAASTTRVFKILKSTAEEYIRIAQVCGVRVGDGHPDEPGLRCVSYSAQYDGDSRMVIVATFNYRVTPSVSGGDGKEQPPDIRPANWSVSTSLQEMPAYVWKAITGPKVGQPDETGPIVNPAGDLYEGVTRLEPIVTISVSQFQPTDPTEHCQYAGYVNSNQIRLGSLTMEPRSCMFRGVQTSPAVELHGGDLFRGWRASFEFAYRVNWVGAPINAAIGWDVLQPQTGFNVKAWIPNFVVVDTDNYSQPLRKNNESEGFSILEPLALPEGIAIGDKVRAQIRIAAPDGKVTQRPSAQPIPLNDDGSGRSESANPKVLLYRYQVQKDIDFGILGIRLE
jgi:hypothetical protein